MINMNFELTDILLGSAALALIALATATIVLFRRLRATNGQIEVMRSDIAALFDAGIGVGHRLDTVEERNRRLTERMEQWELSEPFKRSYKQAVSLIDTGANVQDLIDQCGVTRGEAELLSDLRRLSSLRENNDGKRAASF